MQFMGHLALGYFSSLTVFKITRERFSLPLTLLVSMLPDADLLIPFIQHRTVTHSVLFGATIFASLIIVHHNGLPYIASYFSHILIGDFITSYGIQLFWPLKTWYVSGPPFWMNTTIQQVAEVGLFMAMLIEMAFHHWEATAVLFGHENNYERLTAKNRKPNRVALETRVFPASAHSSPRSMPFSVATFEGHT